MITLSNALMTPFGRKTEMKMFMNQKRADTSLIPAKANRKRAVVYTIAKEENDVEISKKNIRIFQQEFKKVDEEVFGGIEEQTEGILTLLLDIKVCILINELINTADGHKWMSLGLSVRQVNIRRTAIHGLCTGRIWSQTKRIGGLGECTNMVVPMINSGYC